MSGAHSVVSASSRWPALLWSREKLRVGFASLGTLWYSLEESKVSRTGYVAMRLLVEAVEAATEETEGVVSSVVVGM